MHDAPKSCWVLLRDVAKTSVLLRVNNYHYQLNVSDEILPYIDYLYTNAYSQHATYHARLIENKDGVIFIAISEWLKQVGDLFLCVDAISILWQSTYKQNTLNVWLILKSWLSDKEGIILRSSNG